MIGRLMDWLVPDVALMAVGFVPGCSCVTCVPGCPLPALLFLAGVPA